ncbi:MAG: M23 family peptidase, partial [Proteobacteria bacterium]|nr:M23 family peptidase [Pseudomonadota bacterium]
MLNQNTLLTQERKSKLRLFVALSTLPLLGVVTAFGIVPQSSSTYNPSLKTVTEEITLPRETMATLGAINAKSAIFWRNERVERGDTIV